MIGHVCCTLTTAVVHHLPRDADTQMRGVPCRFARYPGLDYTHSGGADENVTRHKRTSAYSPIFSMR